MSHDITVTFIGTTSGGGPSETRNCSSLVVDAVGNGDLWMVDCAEGTVRQFIQQPSRGQTRLRLGRVSKIFITHMHADHTMGTLTFLRNVLGTPPATSTGTAPPPPPNRLKPLVEIYGPRGIRRMIRMLWYTTHTHSEHSFVVHELLFPGQQPSIPADVHEGDANEVDVRRESECLGRDIPCDKNGFWKGVVTLPPKKTHGGFTVDAGPILHRDPCIGYIFREVSLNQPYFRVPRKLVILGDTYDPSPITPLIHDGHPFSASLPEVDLLNIGDKVRVPVTLLVHEATDTFIPPTIDPEGRTGRNRTKESVDAKTVERGHSTPAMAGAFARKIGAERLVMNHIGARFPSLKNGAQSDFRAACIREIERQAAETWNPSGGARPQAAWDFLSVVLPPNPRREQDAEAGPSSAVVVEDTTIKGTVVDRGFAEGELSGAAEISMESAAMRRHEYPRGGVRGGTRERGERARGDRSRGRGRGSQGHLRRAAYRGRGYRGESRSEPETKRTG
ncbi:beta-lactamase-like protein [Fomes fomentarius]|nr:beta-lactamase-like protein [Fomes fomentarius]